MFQFQTTSRAPGGRRAPAFRAPGALVLLMALALLAGPRAAAQLPGPGQNAALAFNLGLIKLFGSVTSFTARAEVRLLDRAQNETMKAPMQFEYLDQGIRVQLDLTEMKHKDVPEALANSLKQLGFSQIVSVLRPDKELSYVIYPELRSFLQLPLAREDAELVRSQVKIDRTKLGNETIDGRECVKSKVLMRNEKGLGLEALVWTAPDLKDFPVQVQTEEKTGTSIIRFSQVQFVKPEAARFAAPTGLRQYADYQDMMKGLVNKMFGVPADKP